MAYPVWQPGTLYQPGDIVVPITAPSPTATAVENGDFSAGASGWNFTGAAFYSTHVSKGGWRTAVELPGNQPSGGALNQTKLVVPVGKKITAACLIDQGASIAGATRGWVEVHWFSASDTLLRIDKGNQVDSGAGGAVHRSTCESICPEGAAYCRAGIELWSVADHNHAIWGGNLWVEGTFAGLPADLAYKAVQPESGFSDASEPAWPPVLGQQVVDNEVTWEAIAATRVVWTAEPLYVSGDTEPEWPEDEGGMVKDGTVTLRAVSRRVEDPNCPNTKIVAIAASKVFCGDDDIVRYSATVNPLDWSTDNDAGYLPTGLQNYGANPVTAMGLYRGNLIAFNAEAFQLWQVDEDPANMALLDALPMGSTQHHAIAPVSNDLFFLASQGVRTVGIAASSTNFQAGDVGMPIDALVQAAMGPLVEPMALYYPAMGQYWLGFPTKTPPVRGPSISGSAPYGVVGEPYGPFSYQISPGDAPIVGTTIDASALLPGFTWDEATATLAGVPLSAGTMTIAPRVTDENGLWAQIEDVVLTIPEIGIVRWDPLTATGGALDVLDEGVTVSATTNTAGSITADTSVSDGDWYWETTTGWYLDSGSDINHFGQTGIVRVSDATNGLVLAQIGTNDGGAVASANALFPQQVLYPGWIPTAGVVRKARIRNRLLFTSRGAIWRIAIDGGQWIEVMTDVPGEYAPFGRSRGTNCDGVIPSKRATIYSRPAEFLYPVPVGSFPLGAAALA